MPKNRLLHLYGYASDIGGASPGSASGPQTLKNSMYVNFPSIQWEDLYISDSANSKLDAITKLNQQTAKIICDAVKQNKFFCVIGGDHTSAIGTWSGASEAIHHKGPLGLLWIDAHMDSHTPETTHTGNFHGMPLASLLGYGEAKLIHIAKNFPAIFPQHICLIGARSFEEEEANLLNKLNVQIYYIEDIKKRGLLAIVKEAISYITTNTAAFGVSLDVDSIDPLEAPGTGVPVADGLHGKDVCEALHYIGSNPDLIGCEIVEFDPTRDINHKTEILIGKLLKSLAGQEDALVESNN